MIFIAFCKTGPLGTFFLREDSDKPMIFVAGATVLGLLLCLVLLMVASRRKVMADDNTTGHVWDEDLVELNNPLPRWWMWLFYITIVFGLAYLFLYPGFFVSCSQD